MYAYFWVCWVIESNEYSWEETSSMCLTVWNSSLDNKDKKYSQKP